MDAAYGLERDERAYPARHRRSDIPTYRRALFALALGAVAVAATAERLRAQTPLLNVPATRTARPTPAVDTVVAVVQGDTVVLSTTARVVKVPIDEARNGLLGTALFAPGAQPAAATASDPTGTWVGATVAYNFASSGEAAEKLGVAGQIVLNNWSPNWTIKGGRVRVPIIGNVARPSTPDDTPEQLDDQARAIATSSEGIYAGIQPYVQWGLGNGYALRPFGTVAIRTTSARDLQTDSTFFLTHGRFSLGLQATLGQFDTGIGSFSVETAYLRIRESDFERAFAERKSGLVSTDVVLILPIAENVGLLGQYVFNHTVGGDVWRAGVALQPAKD